MDDLRDVRDPVLIEKKLRSLLAHNVLRLRARKGWSRETADIKSGLSARTWQRIELEESESPNLISIVLVAVALDVDDPLDLLR